MSRFTEAKSAGFALAALLASDRELTQIEARLAPADEQRVRAQLRAPAAGERAAQVARHLAQVRPPLDRIPSVCSPRLRALLARSVPAAAARDALSGAPPSRAGFELASDLWPRLLRIARRALERDVHREARS